MDETKNVYLISQLLDFLRLSEVELIILENIKHVTIFFQLYSVPSETLDLFVLLEIVKNFQT